jgi:hypothetical protein
MMKPLMMSEMMSLAPRDITIATILGAQGYYYSNKDQSGRQNGDVDTKVAQTDAHDHNDHQNVTQTLENHDDRIQPIPVFLRLSVIFVPLGAEVDQLDGDYGDNHHLQAKENIVQGRPQPIA